MAPEWTRRESAVLRRLDSPGAIQAFLDGLHYSSQPIYRCPRRVLLDRRAHCFDGAVLAAAALERLKFPPLLLDLRAVEDDDHVLALYRVDGRYGALAKSNFTGLRFREPLFRTRRELALSYFEDYFNAAGKKTLREYSLPIDLRTFDRFGWRTEDAAMDRIAARLYRVPHQPLLSARQVRRLLPADPRSMAAGMLGTDRKGLFGAH